MQEKFDSTKLYFEEDNLREMHNHAKSESHARVCTVFRIIPMQSKINFPNYFLFKIVQIRIEWLQTSGVYFHKIRK